MIKIHIEGIFTEVPEDMQTFVLPGDPFYVDLIVDGDTPSEVAAPDYLATNPGVLSSHLIVAVKGPVETISLDAVTGEWYFSGILDVSGILPDTFFSMQTSITSPSHTGLIPDWANATGSYGEVDLAPLSGFIYFDVTDVTTAPSPDPSDDTIDTDGDGVPDGL